LISLQKLYRKEVISKVSGLFCNFGFR